LETWCKATRDGQAQVGYSVVRWSRGRTPLSHLLWSLLYPLWLQLLMSSLGASPMMRSPCWRGSFEPCTTSARRGGDHLGAPSSVTTPPTSSPTIPRGRSSTPPTTTTISSGTTKARVTIRRRRSFRRLCPERVLP
jgi:hypothetical protein